MTQDNPHNEMPKDTVEELMVKIGKYNLDHSSHYNDVKEIIEQALTTAYNKGVEVGRVEERGNVKHEVIKLLAGNTPTYDKRKARGYNEGLTSGWYAAREFIRLELTPLPEEVSL